MAPVANVNQASETSAYIYDGLNVSCKWRRRRSKREYHPIILKHHTSWAYQYRIS